jgi:hypothetical protein
MGVPLSVMLPEDLRQIVVPFGLNAFLEQIYYEDLSIIRSSALEAEIDPNLTWGPQLGVHFRGRLNDNLGVALPSIGGVELVLGAGRIGFDADVDFDTERLSLTLSADVLRLRFARSLLQPVVQKEIADPNDPTGENTITIFEADPDQNKKIELVFQVAVSVDENGDIEVTWPENSPQSLTLPKAMIGDTNVVVEGNLGIDFSTTTVLPDVTGRALDPEWVGVVVRNFKIYLPPDVSGIVPQQIAGSCLIGSNGFSAELHGNWLDAGGNPTAVFKEVRQPDGSMKRFYQGAGSFSFFGLPGGMRSLELDIEDNIPVRSEIEAEFLLPFFDAPVAANLGIGLDGSVDLELRPADDSSDALVKVRKEDLLELTIASLGVHRTGNVVKFGLSGEIKPLIPGTEWPSFRVDDLSIDTKGDVHLEGGWLNLRETYEIDFKGFKLEISKLGFGKNEDGSKWVGFTGGVKLVAGMPAGASVEGLRITWYEDGRNPIVSCNGVRIQFEVPNTLKFEGAVSWDKDLQQFRGAVKLNLMALRMEVDATAVFGTTDGKPYLALYLAAEFPAGIPLFATGLGVYGVAGLFAMNMEPNRADGQAWYSLPPTGDWYHSAPEPGVTALAKWRPVPGSMAFGAGVTLGTIADNGHTFSGRMLLAIVFPGPILMLQGSANILRERATLSSDANFRAFAVLDGRAGTLQLGLDAKYRYDDSGNLIDINGSADGFFNFNDPNDWHLNVGLREPRDQRLTARLFNLFDASAYVMLNPQQLAMGAWVGFEQNWTFGPLSVGLEAWIEGNARVSWKPAHFHGDLALHGSARLAVFGFGAGVTVDAMIAADVFDPLHIIGDFSVSIDLPWPLDEIAVHVPLEWGPQPAKPPIPLPLKEVAIEHFKASTSWPLPREVRSGTQKLLLPNFDGNRNGYFKTPTGDDADMFPKIWNDVPIVPLDSRPHLTFARNINDDALVGVNAMPLNPQFERIGDPAADQGPALVRYGLKEIALEKRKADDTWETVAYKGPDTTLASLPTLYGSWAPVPQMPGGGGRNVGQTKLWLWSKTPFEYTRQTSRSWDEWFTDENSTYPCQTVSTEGWDFEKIGAKSELDDPWQYPDVPGLTFTLNFDDVMSIQELDRPSHGLHYAFGLHGHDLATITLPEKSNLVRFLITDSRLVNPKDFVGRNARGDKFPGTQGGPPERPFVDVRGVDMTSIEYECKTFLRTTIATKLGGARGSAYHPELHQIFFCNWTEGTLGALDVTTGELTVLGTGYQRPEDIVLTADLSTAYITQDDGTLLRLDLTSDNLNRSEATVVSKDMNLPMQIALDEAHGWAYVVEEADRNGRLLRIELETGNQKTIVDRLDKAFGLLLSKNGKVAYVCEIGNRGRLSQVDVETGDLRPRFEELDITFFLTWENEEKDSILAMQWDPDGNWLARFKIASDSTEAEVLEEHWPLPFWSVVVIPNDRVVVVSDDVMTMFATSVLIPKIGDVGGSVFVKHFEDEFIRWTQSGEVLQPNTSYRLKIKTAVRMIGDGESGNYDDEQPMTEFAYFRTAGPPGVAELTRPAGAERDGAPKDKYVSSLDDLSRYILKTMPAVSEPTPTNPVSSRLSYRAYDVGIEFDENYVDLMYRSGRRDLSIHLHDGNGAVRSSDGRRLILNNEWGRAETVTLSDHEDRWLSVLQDGGCQLIPVDSIVRYSTFRAKSVAHLLPASSLCEARLLPALLHDDFGGYNPKFADGTGGRLGRWQISDVSGSGNSHWMVDETTSDPALVQTVEKVSTLFLTNAPTSELPADHPDQPLNWKDYRLTVRLTFSGGKAGLLWRYRDAGNHYRFVIEAGKCELFRVAGGAEARLVSEPFTPPTLPFGITVEIAGSEMNVYQINELGETELLLTATDATIASGSVGFYTSGRSTAKFTDIYVDDFSNAAPVVYRFNFLSSRFKNFKEQMESFGNQTRIVTIDDRANVAPFVSAARAIGDAVADAESRAFAGFLALVPGVVAAPVVQVTRVHQGTNAIAFLVQSPEALDWTRIDVKVLLRAGLQSTQFTNLPVKVLRKADGAGLMIVSTGSTPSGSLFPQGDYRLVFTYRRDNRGVDKDSDVLSEAGDTSPEVVTLNSPWPGVQTPVKSVQLKELLVPA